MHGLETDLKRVKGGASPIQYHTPPAGFCKAVLRPASQFVSSHPSKRILSSSSLVTFGNNPLSEGESKNDWQYSSRCVCPVECCTVFQSSGKKKCSTQQERQRHGRAWIRTNHPLAAVLSQLSYIRRYSQLPCGYCYSHVHPKSYLFLRGVSITKISTMVFYMELSAGSCIYAPFDTELTSTDMDLCPYKVLHSTLISFCYSL